MSYCRFSCDDWKSDVYAYANVSGMWTVHVAARRIVGEIPSVDLSPLTRDDVTEAEIAAIGEAEVAQVKAVQAAERSEVDHPDAGTTRDFPTPGELADYMQALSEAGLHVPEWVVPELRAEQAAMDAEGAQP